MQYVKRIIFAAFAVLLALSACQDYDNDAYLSQSLQNVSAENEASKSLFALLQQQKDAYVGIKKALGDNTPKFELTEIGSTSLFGPFYIFPYTNGKDIEGSIIIPMDEGISQIECRSVMGKIGTPIRMDTYYLNNKIPKLSRFLYSYYFLNWKDHGKGVAPLLSQFADDINQDNVPVTEEEIKSVVKPVRTRAGTTSDRMGYIRIEFNLVYYLAPSSTDEVEAVALNRKVQEEIFRKAFMMYENETYMKFIAFSKGYRLMSVQFLITDKKFYNNTIEYSIKKILERVRQMVYEKGFNITFQYTYYIPPLSYAFPDIGGSQGPGGGSGGTGGTPSGSPTGKPKKDDEKDFVVDCSSYKVQYKDAVNGIVGNVKNAKVDDEAYRAITWNDYLNTVKDAKIEYSTRLEMYPGLDMDNRPTVTYQLKPMISGTENKVDNESTKYTLAEIHNHPNGTPPSFQDVLYTAKQAADNDTTYRTTFVYEAKEDAFYAIYIHDRQKASRFYEEIKDQVDSETMMPKEDSEIYRLLKQHSISSNSRFLKHQLSAIFELMDSGISFYKINNESITSYDVRKTNNTGRTKITFVKCP